MTQKTKNVVVYARFSSSKQNETSIEAQLRVCYEYCKVNNLTVIGEYIDRAKSAKTDNRPDFKRMINDSNKKQFQGIVCYQLDRFARNRYDSAIYKSKLKKNGVRVYSAKENINDDASGILMESVLEGMAEYYSKELSQKVNRNMRLNAMKGYFNGGFAPLGYKVVTVDCGTYKKKRLEVDAITSKVVKEIFELRADETKIDYIIDILNHKGYKNINGKKFTRNSLQSLLKNKRYIGTNMYGDEEFPNTIPAIIDKDLFNRVQKVIEKNKKGPGKAKAKEEYLLTTKLICDCCGEKMKGISGKSKNGTIYRYYTCKTNNSKQKCKRKNINKDYLENLVINKCKEILNDKNIEIIAKQVYRMCQKENNKNLIIKEYENKIKETEKAINNLLLAIEKGANVDLINERIITKRKELEEIKVLLAKEKNKLININEQQIRFFLSQLKDGNINDIVYKKKLINIFVNEVHLTEDEVIIIFNVSKQKITLSIPKIDNVKDTYLNTFAGCLYNTVVVSQEGFEPPTPGLEGPCSIQLSY